MPSETRGLPDTARGRAWVFGDDISTDLLAPGMYAAAPLAERVTHTLESVNPRFAREVSSDDIVVAGRNFGCGSSRETAPEALKALGVGCVVAESMARIFLRNAVAIGLPVLVCPGVTQAVSDGDPVAVTLGTGMVRNERTGTVVRGSLLPPLMREILGSGGMMPLLRARAARQHAGSGWVSEIDG